MNFRRLSYGLLLIILGLACAKAQNRTGITRVPVVFSGGHETDPRDHGRPVVLIAGALGIPPPKSSAMPLAGSTRPIRKRALSQPRPKPTKPLSWPLWENME